jgi:hypothetical protein
MLTFLSACTEYNVQGEEPAPEAFDTGSSYAADTGGEDRGPPDIEVDPRAVDHGTVEQGAALQTVVTITNVGESALTLGPLRTSWSTAFDPTGAILAPRQSLAVALSTTAEVGEHVEGAVIESDDPDEPRVEVTLRYDVEDRCSWGTWHPMDDCSGPWTGTGVDGDVELSGDFLPPTTTLAADATSTELALVDPIAVSVDDELFVHAPDGRFTFARVLALPATVDAVLGLPAGSVVQRVPHYEDVRVAGALTGARIVFRACGGVTLDSDIDALGTGWQGGQRPYGIPEAGWQGTSELGPGVQSTAPNGTAGGGGGLSCNVHTDGGGGGHATPGAIGGSYASYWCVGPAGEGGGTIGDADLGTIHFGGSGGSGHMDNDGEVGSYGGAGGNGGGIVIASAAEGFTGSGIVMVDGGRGEDGYYAGSGASPGGGGGGAGGTAWLLGQVGVSIYARGGLGGVGSEAGGLPTYGGTGGVGFVRVDGDLAGSSEPEANRYCE